MTERPVAKTYVVVDRPAGRERVVRALRSVVSYVTRLFAVVLIGHIVLVLANANPGNPFAGIVEHWASGLSFGLHNLFTPDNAKLRTLVDEGAAAILWLVIGGAANYVIRQVVLPGSRRSRYGGE